MKKTFLTVAILGSMLLSNCAKKGEVGPAGTNGATGPQGPSGTNGKDGTNGTNGTNGNANVVGSNTITLSTASWTGTNGIFTAKITSAAITQDIVDKGTVLVFVKYGTEWVLLPDILGKNITNYAFGLGYISLMNFNTDFSTNTNPGAKTFRIDVIAAN